MQSLMPRASHAVTAAARLTRAAPASQTETHAADTWRVVAKHMLRGQQRIPARVLASAEHAAVLLRPVRLALQPGCTHTEALPSCARTVRAKTTARGSSKGRMSHVRR